MVSRSEAMCSKSNPSNFCIDSRCDLFCPGEGEVAGRRDVPARKVAAEAVEGPAEAERSSSSRLLGRGNVGWAPLLPFFHERTDTASLSAMCPMGILRSGMSNDAADSELGASCGVEWLRSCIKDDFALQRELLELAIDAAAEDDDLGFVSGLVGG